MKRGFLARLLMGLPAVWNFICVHLLPYVAIALTIHLGVVRRYEG